VHVGLLLQPARPSECRGKAAGGPVVADKIAKAFPPILKDMDEFVREKCKAFVSAL
jgi:hypothetical protein